MSELSTKICFFAIICTVVSVIIKQCRPEYAFLVRLASTVGICAVAISVAGPIIEYIKSIFDVGINENYPYVQNVLKALGVAVLTEICADICRDLGESSAASGVELVGRIEILLLCIPMFEAVMKTVSEVLAW